MRLIQFFVKVPPTSSNVYSLRHLKSSIVCGGVNGDNQLEYQVKASTYAAETTVPTEDEVFVCMSQFLAPNIPGTIPTTYIEINHTLFATTSDKLRGNLTNKTAVSGLGLIMERYTVEEEEASKPTVVAVIEHCDYNIEVHYLCAFC